MKTSLITAAMSVVASSAVAAPQLEDTSITIAEGVELLETDIDAIVEGCMQPIAKSVIAQIYGAAASGKAQCDTDWISPVNPFAPSRTTYCDVETPLGNGQKVRVETNGVVFLDIAPTWGHGRGGLVVRILEGDTADSRDGVRLSADLPFLLLDQNIVEEFDEFGRRISGNTFYSRVQLDFFNDSTEYSNAVPLQGGIETEYTYDAKGYASCLQKALSN